jgi:hypothetical protein
LNAEEALAGHLVVSAQYGDELADASELDTIARDPEVHEVARLLVRGERAGKSVRLNVSLDEGLVAAIDKVAKNRSGFLADAVRAALRLNAGEPLLISRTYAALRKAARSNTTVRVAAKKPSAKKPAVKHPSAKPRVQKAAAKKRKAPARHKISA